MFLKVFLFLPKTTFMKCIFRIIYFLLALAFLFVLDEFDSPNKLELKIQNITKLDSLFVSENYYLDSIFIDSVVPAIFTVNISESIRTIDTKKKKSLFIKMLLSNILISNKNILEERVFLLSLKQKQDITRKERRRLKKIAKKYSGKIDNLDELLQRVDIVPPSLAIAQAITESGWGTSRYAIQGNALFGHHVSKNDTSKFIQSQNSNVRMKAFNSILASVEAYMHNINSTRAYRLLRKRRAERRRNNDAIIGKDLANYLTRYSERGIEYTIALKSMIRQQKLARFDFVRLGDKPSLYIWVLE